MALSEREERRHSLLQLKIEPLLFSYKLTSKSRRFYNKVFLFLILDIIVNKLRPMINDLLAVIDLIKQSYHFWSKTFTDKKQTSFQISKTEVLLVKCFQNCNWRAIFVGIFITSSPKLHSLITQFVIWTESINTALQPNQKPNKSISS